MVLFAGSDGQKYIPIGAAADTIFMWTVGIIFFTYRKGSGLASGLKNLRNPVIISVIVGLLVTSFDIPIPAFVGDAVTSVGNCSTPLALIYLGANLCFVKLNSTSMLKQIFSMVAVRMIVAPILVYTVSGMFLNETETIFLTVMCATPVMASAASVANQYHLDEDYAAAAIFVSTIACLFTIPLVFFITALL